MDIRPSGRESSAIVPQAGAAAQRDAQPDAAISLPVDNLAGATQATQVDIKKAAGALWEKAPEAAVPPEVSWSFQAPSTCNAPPVTGPEGNIYVRVSGNALVALDTKGNTLWSAPLSDTFGEAPVTDDRGNVYVADASYGTFKIISYDSQGSQRWEYEHKCSGSGSRIGGMERTFVDRDSNSVLVPFKNMVHCIDLDSGAPHWTFKISDYEYGDIGYLDRGPDGNFYIACPGDGKVHVLDPETGQDIKALKGAGEGRSLMDLTVGGDGTVFTVEIINGPSGGSIRGMRAMTPDGQEKWFTKGEFMGQPLVGKDGTVYLRREEGKERYSLNALDGTTGKLRWFMPIEGNASQDPVLTPDGSLLLNVEIAGKATRKSSSQGKRWSRAFEENPVSQVICIKPDGLTEWVMAPGAWLHSSLSIDEKKGVLYAATNTGECIGIDLAKLRNAVEQSKKKSSQPEAEPIRIEIDDEFIDVGGIKLPIARS